MSTLPGVASKGEKGKSKYQSLDINNLYKVYTTEPSETQQPKSALPRKHGMQSLGKVPTARRPPANLPSLKSEHTGSDAAVSLVPSGGPGWGKQEPHSPSSTTPPSVTSVPSSNTTSPSSVNVPVPQPVIAVPVPPIPPPIKHHLPPTATPVTTDKSWSSIMSADIFQPPPYQSPQFQHEFPSLSAGDGAPPRTGVDTQYGPGPSLRPQTEGSWIQGGVRPGTETIPKGNSAQLAPPQQLSGQAGHMNQQQQPLPPQFRGVMPQFLLRGNFTPNGPAGPNFTGVPGSVNNGRNPAADNRTGQRRPESDEVLHRPIIKEEELNRMDDMTRDVGWASHDDIDYNQKLAFSDDEGDVKKGNKQASIYREHDKTEHNSHEVNNKSNWNNSKSGSNAQPAPSTGNKIRSNEEDDVWTQRRRQQSEDVAMAVERAKQRKEEEEKRFLETKQAAAKKLQELEEKLNKTKIDKEIEDSQGTINPSVVPPQPITPVPIPIPDWEKEKDNRPRSSGIETSNNKQQYRESSDFRKLTQIEARSFIRKETRSSERDREQGGPSFSKQFQSNLPPRFLKQLRSNAPSTPQSPPTSNNSNNTFNEQYESHWQQNQKHSSANLHNKSRLEVEEHEHHQQENEPKEIKPALDDNYKVSHNSYSDTNKIETKQHEENREYRHDDFVSRKDTKKDEKWEKEIKPEKKNVQSMFDDHRFPYSNDRDKPEEKFQDRYERPQRPDSRDSRASRDSRHSRESEPRDYRRTWTDSPYESSYDDRRKEHYKEDRRSVPGPITRDRIEADDLKSEKKNLTQLKRGYIPDKRQSDFKKNVVVQEKVVVDDGWTLPKNRDNVNTEIKPASEMQPLKSTTPDNTKLTDIIEKPKVSDVTKPSEEKGVELDKKDDKDQRPINIRRHGDSRSLQWGTGGVVYPRTWSKRNDSSRRGGRSGPPRKSLAKGGESHGTDSDVSGEDISSTLHSKKSEKDDRNKEIKQEKQDKPYISNERKFDSNKKDNYLPRGEPSRHGRGAGNFRNRGGLGKRIDGYGPPPSKSPFSQLEDKKLSAEEGTPSDATSSDEKTKQNQQALSAGIIGSNRSGIGKEANLSLQQQIEDKADKGTKSMINATSSKKDSYSMENIETSENSDEYGGIKNQKSTSKFGVKSSGDRLLSNNVMRRNNPPPPPRFSNDKRNYNLGMRQNSSSSVRSGSGKTADDFSKNKNKSTEELKSVVESDSIEKVCDSDGFQEVKSKKTGPRQKSVEEKPIVAKPAMKIDKPLERKKSNGPTPILTPEQIASLPSLMDTPINPPQIVNNNNNNINNNNSTNNNKNQYDRSRQKLPPRFAKQRENSRLQKVQMHSGMCDFNDMNKVNHNLNVYNVKDTQNSVSGRIGNAWEKPLSTHMRTDQEVMLSVGMDSVKTAEQPQQSTSPNIDKVIKSNHVAEKTVLDGTTPPVNTIIFENTNFKTAPGSRSSRSDKSSTNDSVIDQTVIPNFNKPGMRDLLNKNEKQSEAIDMNDMKLDFFETEISHLTDDKVPKNLALSRSMHTITSANNNNNNTLSASTTDALNFKIASVKRVWENAPSGIEHNIGQDDSNSSFSTSFGTDPNALDSSAAFAKNSEAIDEAHETYPSSPNQNTSSNTTNVCKVKPTQQVNSGGQAVHVAGTIPSAVIGPSIVGHPLSPPPMPPVLGGGVGIGQPPQQYTSNQHISYQPSIGGSNQYGMSAIPSPPTVLFNSTPQIQAAQTGLYGAFQIDQAQVLSSQGRTQFSQYPYNIGQTASSPYSAQSMYLQGAQPHPPTGQPPPDIYQNLNSYRLSTAGPFGQGQQLTNPSTVLISSTSNSLMSATVKPTTQQISAIGTKATGAGQAYQPQSQQGQQLYMTYDPSSMQANYLSSTGVMQRPTAPLQNNVVPAIQQSSSYYTGSTGGQTSFFQQPASSTLQSAQLSHTGYGLQGNVFGSHNQSHASAGLTNFGPPYLSNPMQLAAAALSAQYRSNNLQNSPYVKSVNIGDQGTRPGQIKSPNAQQDVLSSVFNTGPQIPSPKSRQNMKQPAPQPSPTAQLKYNLYQTVGNSQQAPRFPSPIQRPVNYQTNLGAMQGNTGSSNNPKHRSAGQNKLSGRNYYGQVNPRHDGVQLYVRGNNLSSTQNDKGDDTKLGDAVTSNSSNPPIVSNTTSIVTKAIITTNSTITVNQTTEIKETSTKDESSVIKD